MVIKKLIKIDTSYEATFIPVNASWWNENVDAVVLSPEILISSSAESWYTGKKIISSHLHYNNEFDIPLYDPADGASLYYPSPTRVGPVYDKATQDLRSTIYRNSWISNIKNLIDNGAEGIYINDVRISLYDSATRVNGEDVKGDLSWWEDTLVNFLEEIKEELKDYKSDFIIIHATSWKDKQPLRWENSNVQRQIEQADYISLPSSHTDPNLNSLSAQNPITDERGYSFRSLLQYIDYIHSVDKNIVLLGENSTADKFKFNIASYYLTYSSGDYLSISGSQVNEDLSTILDINIGNPVGKRKDYGSDPNNASFIYRDYTTGHVRVTPISYAGDPITSTSSVVSLNEPSNEYSYLPFPSTTLVDNFNTVGSYNSSIFVSPFYGTKSFEVQVVGGNSRAITPGADAASNIVYIPEQEVWYDSTAALSAYNNFQIYTRLTKNASNEITCYCLEKTTNGFRVSKIINGTKSFLGGEYVDTYNNLLHLGLRAYGSVIEAWKKGTDNTWVKAVTYNDSSIPGAGRVGFKIPDISTDEELSIGPNEFGGGALYVDFNGNLATPNNSYLNIEELSSGSTSNYIKGSGLSKKGIESIIEFNGVRLNDSSKKDYYSVNKIVGLFDMDIRDNRIPRPNQDGEVPQESKYSGRTITIDGEIVANTREKLLDMETALQMAFYPLEEKQLVFRTGDIRRDFFISCKKTQPIDIVEEQTGDYHKRVYQITLRASDPYFYSVNDKEAVMNIRIDSTPTLTDNFVTDKLVEPEYFDTGHSYTPADPSRSIIKEVSSDTYFKHSSVNQNITEKKLNGRFGLYHKQNTNFSNFTQITKVKFSKFPKNAASNISAGRPTIKYPIVTYTSAVKELRAGEKYPKGLVLNNFSIAVDGDGNQQHIYSDDLEANSTHMGTWDVNPYEKQITGIDPSLATGDYITLMENNPNNKFSSIVISKYGSDAVNGNYFNSSYIIENLGSTTKLLPDTYYWFVFSSSVLSYTTPQGQTIPYRINTKRVYDEDPLGGTSPSPIISFVYRTKDWGVGNLGIATANTDECINWNIEADLSGISGGNTAAARRAIYAAISLLTRGVEPGVYISNYGTYFPNKEDTLITANIKTHDTSTEPYKFIVEYIPGSSSADTSYQGGDTTTYDDYKILNYDINSPNSQPSVAKVITNSGSSKARPVFTINGNMSRGALDSTVLSIKNITNGTVIAFSTDNIGRFIPSGDELVVDCNNRKAYLKYAGTNYDTYIDFDSDWITLEQGENTIVLEGQSMTNANASVKFKDIYL